MKKLVLVVVIMMCVTVLFAEDYVTKDQYDWLFWSSIFFVVLLFVLHLIQSKKIDRHSTSNQLGLTILKREVGHCFKEIDKIKDLHRILEDKHGNQHYEIRQCMSNITNIRDCLHDGKTFFENPDLDGKKVNIRCENCGKLMETISLQEYYERKAEEARSGQKQ